MAAIKRKRLHYASETIWSDEALTFGRRGRIKDLKAEELEFEQVEESNPEVMLTSSHAVCYASALLSLMEQTGYDVDQLLIRSMVTLAPQEDGSYTISQINLHVAAEGGEGENDRFRELVEEAEQVCPISGALSGETPIDLDLSRR